MEKCTHCAKRQAFFWAQSMLMAAVVLGITPAHCAPAGKASTYLTLDGPVGPPGRAGTPVLQTVTAEYNVMNRNGRHVDIRPNFQFVAPMGNAVTLHRELLETDSAILKADIRNAPVHASADAQRAGATVKGGWVCGTSSYHITLKAWLVDAQGHAGNALKYTIHCNEQLLF
jgi:hypothetical protein